MQYKLTYSVASPIGNNEPVEVISTTELELAEAILDMERDVGAICHGVKIETGDFDDNQRSKNQRAVVKQIAHYCKVLDKAIHI
tara:strand:+ start:52 stop:303 length:252 start_codon:yes stop_codon:yes gene_type:complete